MAFVTCSMLACSDLGVCLPIWASLGHTPCVQALQGMGGAGGRVWSEVGCSCRCHRPLCIVLVLRVENPQWVQALFQLDHTAPNW